MSGTLPWDYQLAPAKMAIVETILPFFGFQYSLASCLCFGECTNPLGDPMAHLTWELVSNGTLKRRPMRFVVMKDAPTPHQLRIWPIGSMYGIFTYIYHKSQPNVGRYTIHGSYGWRLMPQNQQFSRHDAADFQVELPRLGLSFGSDNGALRCDQHGGLKAAVGNEYVDKILGCSLKNGGFFGGEW